MSDDHSKNLASLVLEEIDAQRALMSAVATTGPLIKDVNDEYKARRKEIRDRLDRLGVLDPNPYRDLWDWYERWTSGDLPSYRARRQFLREMYAPLIAQLENVAAGLTPGTLREPTGWPRVDRCLEKMRVQLATAIDEEDYQQVGLLGREVVISLAQAVYDPARHPPVDEVIPSGSDAARMLACYIGAELAGEVNDEVRGHAKAALKLAVTLQHKRTADFRIAALCTEATASVVNIFAIVSGRRDPDLS